MRFNVQTELRKLAKGKASRVPTAIVLRTAADFLQAYSETEQAAQIPEADWLEELYQLPDTRPEGEGQ